MNFDITLTWSKIMSLLILVATSWYSLANKEATVITIGIAVSAGLLGWKQQKDKEIKKLS